MSAKQAQQTIEESRVEDFLGRVIGDIAGTMTTVFCGLGDRLGLLAAPARHRSYGGLHSARTR